jgi:hypothetical protein
MSATWAEERGPVIRGIGSLIRVLLIDVEIARSTGRDAANRSP